MPRIDYGFVAAIEQSEPLVDEFRLAFWFLSLTEVLAWHESCLLRGISLTKKPDKWQMVVRVTAEGRRGDRKHQVAIIYGHDIAECVANFAHLIKKRSVPWMTDKYA